MASTTTETPANAPRSVVLGSIWRARWPILAAVVLAGILGYLVSSQQTPTYFTNGRIVLGASAPFAPPGTQTSGDPTRYVANQVAIIGTQPVLDAAANRLGDGTTTGDLAGGLTVTGSGDNDVISVGTTGPTPQAAAARANAVITAYRDFVRGQVATAVRAATAGATDPALADQVRTAAAVYGDGVAEVEPAFPPGGPASPSPVRDGLLLAALAALIGIGVSLVVNRGPRPTPDSLAAAAGGRLLGVVPVPREPMTHGTMSQQEQSEHALALVAVDYATHRSAPGPVLLSAGRNAGTSAATAVGLARAAAAAGRRVLLVDGDPGGRGVLELCSARPQASLEQLGRQGVGEVDVLAVLPPVSAGAAPLRIAAVGDDPVALVDVHAVRDALRALGSFYDLALVHVGPVSASPAAFSLLDVAGAVVLVAGEDDPPTALAEAGRQVQAADRSVTGVLVTREGRRRLTRRSPTDRPATGRTFVPAPELSRSGPA